MLISFRAPRRTQEAALQNPRSRSAKPKKPLQVRRAEPPGAKSRAAPCSPGPSKTLLCCSLLPRPFENAALLLPALQALRKRCSAAPCSPGPSKTLLCCSLLPRPLENAALLLPAPQALRKRCSCCSLLPRPFENAAWRALPACFAFPEGGFKETVQERWFCNTSLCITSLCSPTLCAWICTGSL